MAQLTIAENLSFQNLPCPYWAYFETRSINEVLRQFQEAFGGTYIITKTTVLALFATKAIREEEELEDLKRTSKQLLMLSRQTH